MGLVDKEERLKQEAMLRTQIEGAVDGICHSGNHKYEHVCKYASASATNRKEVVDKVLNLMLSDNLPSGLIGALSQVDELLNGDNGDNEE